MSSRPTLSVVIPAFNEQDRLPSSLEKIHRYLDNSDLSYEVIVVDDGSGDNTPVILNQLAEEWPCFKPIRTTKNHGKGYATKRGVQIAQGTWILTSDADLSTPIQQVEPMLERAKGYPVVIGSRSIAGSHIAKRQPFYRVWMGRMFNQLVSVTCDLPFRDTQCGFKLYERQAAQKIFEQVTIHGFAFDVEVLTIARKLGFSIWEEPVTWYNDESTKVHLIRDPICMFADIVRIRRRHRG